MITSDRQLQIALEKFRILEESIKKQQKANLPKILLQASKGQTQELMNELKAEIEEYQHLRNDKLKEILIHSLEDLMNAPIRYRLAKKMTIEQFAREVSIHSRQVARYEAEGYRNVTIDTLLKILNKINAHVSGEVKISQSKAS